MSAAEEGRPPGEPGHGLPELIAERRAKAARVREADPDRIPVRVRGSRADRAHPARL